MEDLPGVFNCRYNSLSTTPRYDSVFCLSSTMDKAALVRALVTSERNHSKVAIKIVNDDKPIVGAVQKVLNQIIILKSVTSAPITLTFADIVSVKGCADSFFNRLLNYFRKN